MSSALERTAWVMPAAECSNDLRLSTHGRTVPRPQPPISCMHCSHVPGAHSFWHSGNTQRSPIRASSYQPRIVIGQSAEPCGLLTELNGQQPGTSHKSCCNGRNTVHRPAWNAWLGPGQKPTEKPTKKPIIRSTWLPGVSDPQPAHEALARLGRAIFWKLKRTRSGVPVGPQLPTSADLEAMPWAPNALSSSATPAVSLRLDGG